MFHGINDRTAADIHIRQRPVFRSFRIKPGSLPADRFDHLIRNRPHPLDRGMTALLIDIFQVDTHDTVMAANLMH